MQIFVNRKHLTQTHLVIPGKLIGIQDWHAGVEKEKGEFASPCGRQVPEGEAPRSQF